MRGLILLWSCACVVSLGLAPAAWAQSDPQVDPDSPAGQEYELPIDRARDQARPGRPKGTTQTPLFGEGVDRIGSARVKQPSSPQTGSGELAAANSREVGAQKRSPVSKETVRAQARSPATDTSQLLAIGAGGVGVLLIGGLTGLAWRRRSTRH